VGIPARYGGFETLAENLVAQNRMQGKHAITVWCSGLMIADRRTSYLGAELRYLPLRANGVSSVPFDILSLILAAWRGADAALVLGVSGAIAFPFLRAFSRMRIVTNVDGLEWKRLKWGPGARTFLRFSERMAVRWSHEVIADNPAIAEHLREAYGRDCPVIAYGGEHVVEVEPKPFAHALPPRYGLAISRIEPENNAEAILRAFARRPGLPLLYFGNWDETRHGRNLKLRFSEVPHLHLLPAEHDRGRLRTLRAEAEVYVHGHSAGGTNPSLVEAMQFGRPVIAFDCAFNRHTTANEALYFTDADSLGEVLDGLGAETAARVGAAMRRIATERYQWPPVAARYFELLAAG
jgi:glycosyltransferase involved in cell wall biosynthesis